VTTPSAGEGQEAAPFQPLREQAEALAVVPQALDVQGGDKTSHWSAGEVLSAAE